MLHVISARCVAHDCTRLRLGHLSMRVGDSLRRCEEIVKKKKKKKSRIAPLIAIIIIIFTSVGALRLKSRPRGTSDLEKKRRKNNIFCKFCLIVASSLICVSSLSMFSKVNLSHLSECSARLICVTSV